MMLPNCQQNLKRIESLKFFQFLNQISPDQLQNYLNGDIYNRIYRTLTQSDSTVIVNQHQFTAYIFCELFSKCYQSCICSYSDIARYYREINDIMMEKYCKENKMGLVNKNCFFTIRGEEAIEDYNQQLKQPFNTDTFYYEYTNMIAYVNHVLMSIYVPTQENLQNFKLFCIQLSENSIYQKVCRAIMQNVSLGQSYKFLIFLIDGFYHFPQLKQLIYTQQKGENNNLGDIFNIALNKLIENKLDPSPKVQVISFLNAMVRQRIQCAEKLVKIVEQNDNLKGILSQGQILSGVDIHHIQQLSELLLFLVKKDPKKVARLYLSLQKIALIQTFAIAILKKGCNQFYQGSILLINETIKYNIIDDDQVANIVLKALETNNYSLRKAALLVLESAFIFGKEEIVEVFLVKRGKYFTILQEFLREPFGEGCQSTHFLCLQIIHLLVTSNYSNNFIMEQCMNEILVCLAAPLNQCSIFHSFICEIIRNMCFRSLKNQRQYKYQNYINFTTFLKIILSSLYVPDQFTKIMNINTNNFPSKIIICNIIQSLYYLFERNNALKLIQHQMITSTLLQEIDNTISILVDVIIKISVDGKLGQYFKGQIMLQNQKKSNILTLLFNTLQNICCLFKNANRILRRRLFKHRQLLLSQIYKLMPVKQLQSQKIPIIIKYSFSFTLQERPSSYIDRFLPITVSYNDYESYCLSLVQDENKRLNGHEVFLGIFFRDLTHGNSEIKDQIGYKRMVLRYLENRNTEFNANIEIIKDHSTPINPISLIGPICPISPISPIRPISPANNAASPHTYSSPYNHYSGAFNTINTNIRGAVRPRTPSPFRNNQSRVIPGPYICQLCNRNPTSPHQRTCNLCNRR